MKTNIESCQRCGSGDIGYKMDGTRRMWCNHCELAGPSESKEIPQDGAIERSIERWNITQTSYKRLANIKG